MLKSQKLLRQSKDFLKERVREKPQTRSNSLHKLFILLQFNLIFEQNIFQKEEGKMKVRFELEIVDGQYLLTILGSGGSKDVKHILKDREVLREAITDIAFELRRRQND